MKKKNRIGKRALFCLAVLVLGCMSGCIIQTRGMKISVADEKKKLMGLSYRQLVERYGMPERGRPDGRMEGEIAPPSSPRFAHYSYVKTYLLVLYYLYRNVSYTFVLEDDRVVDLFEHRAEKASGLTILGIMPVINIAGPAAGGGAPP